MLDTPNHDPQCTACGSPMKLTAIEPGETGQEMRTFFCPQCKRVQLHIIESAGTEAWPEPQRAIKARLGNAVTYETDDGRMIAKRAR
jgi:hypothetical protein